MAVEDYKRARPSKYSSKAKKIYEDFIAVKSSKEVSFETCTTEIEWNGYCEWEDIFREDIFWPSNFYF